jgi:hypothetical protein
MPILLHSLLLLLLLFPARASCVSCVFKRDVPHAAR